MTSRAQAKPAGNLPDWFWGVLLVALTAAAYLRVTHAGFIWDDDAYLTRNPLLTAPDGLWRIWFTTDSPSQYFPLTYTAFWLERALWGLQPLGYHLVNVALHAANAWLVWRIFLRLNLRGAWLAAAIFALHPVQVESVAWITERKNVLMGFFYLLSVLMWLRFLETDSRRKLFYGWSLAFFALALLAKTIACTLPVALVLILWWQNRRIDLARVRQIVPYLGCGAAMGLVSMWWERYHQGTHGALFHIGWMERILIASRAFWFYLGKLIWPTGLIFNYPHWTISASNPTAYLWLAAVVALVIALVALRRKAITAAVIFFGATLLPVLGFIMLYTFQYTFVADHYQYLACLGPIALFATGWTLALTRWPSANLPLQGILLVTLGVLTWQQCGEYRDAETLWRATLARNPDSWLAHNDLALILRQRGDVPEAIIHYEAAAQEEPQNEDIHFNLARAYLQVGNLPKAIEQFGAALQLAPTDIEAENNLAWLLATASPATLRNGARAVKFAEAANTAAQGRNPIILRTLAAAYAEAHRFPEAVRAMQSALAREQAGGGHFPISQWEAELQRYQTNKAWSERGH